MRGIVRGEGAQKDGSGFDDAPAVNAAMHAIAAVRGAGACPNDAQVQGFRDGDTSRQFLRVGFGQTSTNPAVGSIFVIEADRDNASEIRVAEVDSVDVEQFAMAEAQELSSDDTRAVLKLLVDWMREEFSADPNAPVDKMENALREGGYL